jgi:hypothetical protein
MGKLTGKEIIEKIIANLEEPYEFEELTDGDFENEDGELLGLGKAKMVADEEFTSGEAWRILYFEEHDVYIRQNGYYNSYESYAVFEEHDYDVVVPFEKTVTDYKKVD